MAKRFFLAVMYEGIENGCFWALWKSDDPPIEGQVCWECGFAPTAKAAVRAARGVETVNESRVQLINPMFAHAMCATYFPNMASARSGEMTDEDRAFDDLRARQCDRDVRRARNSAASRARRREAPRSKETPAGRPASRPASTAPVRPSWCAVLRVGFPCTPEEVRKAFRARVKKVHPDVGGSVGTFIVVKAAYDEALRDLGVN